MSVKAITWAWRQKLPATEKLVLLALADHSNDEDFRAWPSLSHLADKCGLHRRSVIRLLAELETAGYLHRENRGLQTTVYTLVIPSDTQSLGTQGHYGHSDTRDAVSGGSDTRSPEVVTQRHTEPSLEPSKNRQSGQSGQKNRFEEYWSTLPVGKKVKRKDAEKVWKSKQLDRLADQIIADVKNRLANDDRWRRGFIPDPPTYLRQERWQDEISQPPGQSSTDQAPQPRYLS